MKFNYILFDLDGTLTDPGIGITNSIKYALEYFGIKVKDRESLYKYIGPPLLDSFRDFNGFDIEKSKLAMQKYREYFGPKGIFENVVYDGIEETLTKLTENGKKLYVATSKPELYARQILEHYNLSKYFTFCGGNDMAETRMTKADVINYVLKENSIVDKNECLMVGDRKYDIIGAKTTGLISAGVLYGYGSKEELTEAGAEFIIQKPSELINLILG